MAYNKYQKLVLQGSNDGVNWVIQEPRQYRRGEIIEENSIDCGGSGGNIRYRWITMPDEFMCINNDKYQLLKKQVFNYETSDWEDVDPIETQQGELVEKDSEYCGYGVQWVDTDRLECVKFDYYRVYTTISGSGSIYISPSKEEYLEDESVEITNVPSEGYYFSRYSYGITDQYGKYTTDMIFRLPMTNDWYVKAIFESKPESGCLQYVHRDGNDIWINWSYSGIRNIDHESIKNVASAVYDHCGIIRRTYPYEYSLDRPYDEGAFEYCDNLQTVSFPQLSIIGYNTFASCSELSSVSIPQAKILSDNAFRFCRKLESLDIPNVISIGSGAFGECFTLSTISTPKVISIQSYAFLECIKLQSFIAPNLLYIHGHAFESCFELSKFDAPNVLSIYHGAFESCSNLVEVNIESAQYIGYGCFYRCGKISELYLPNVSFIGEKAFYSCANLENVYLMSDKVVSFSATFTDYGEPLPLGTFELAHPNLKVHVPRKLYDTYYTRYYNYENGDGRMLRDLFVSN